MNGEKKSKWDRFLGWNLFHVVWAAFLTVIAPLIMKATEKHGGINLMESIYQSYFVELWPVWFGIGLGLAYLVVWRIVLIDNFLRKGLKFDDKLNELGIERRELMTHVNNSYNGLSNKLDRSISELSNKIEKVKDK